MHAFLCVFLEDEVLICDQSLRVVFDSSERLRTNDLASVR